MQLETTVVGAGVVSRVHCNGLVANPRTELVGVCDLDRERAESAAEEYDTVAYTDVGTLLEDGSPDWIHVCTPVGTHLDVASRAIRYGVPVLVEKPVTESLDQLERLRSTAEDHGVRTSVVHNQLYAPAVRTARRAIDEGKLGTVRGVDLQFTGLTPPDEANRGDWAFDLPGGEFEEGLPHPIYLVLGTGGLPESDDSIRATTTLRGEYDRNFTFDEAGFQYTTSGGEVCSATMRAGAIPQRVLTIHGDRRSLEVDLLSQTVVTLDSDYAGSPVARARNNVDRSFDRLVGTAGSAAMFGRTKLRDDWSTQRSVNSHYYLFDREVAAIRDGADVDDGMERAHWTMAVLGAIRESAGPRLAQSA